MMTMIHSLPFTTAFFPGQQITQARGSLGQREIACDDVLAQAALCHPTITPTDGRGAAANNMLFDTPDRLLGQRGSIAGVIGQRRDSQALPVGGSSCDDELRDERRMIRHAASAPSGQEPQAGHPQHEQPTKAQQALCRWQRC